MPDESVLLHWLLFLAVVLWMQRRKLRQFIKALRQEWKERLPRRWKAQSPHDCQQCRAVLRLEAMRAKADIEPYSQRKSRRGRKKRVATEGYACPNARCDYRGVTDSGVHALVGYGTPNGIQRLKCQACAKVFTCRVNTPLYYLKTEAREVEFVLWFLAEGVDVSVLVRFTGHADATVARWLERMGRHSQGWHNVMFRNLVLRLVQMDELYTRVRATASAAWLWLVIDPVSKAIPALHVGGERKTTLSRWCMT